MTVHPPWRRLAFALAVLPAWAAAQNAVPVVPTVITGDSLEGQSSDADTTTTVLTGHVVVTGTNLEVHCDRLVVVSGKVSDPNATIGQQTNLKSMVATGHVDIRQTEGLREATCGRAEVIPAKNEIVLTENPVVTDHGNGSVTAGDEIDLLRGQRRVIVTHPHMILPPMKDLGFDKKQAPPDTAPSSPAPSSTQPPP